MELLKRLNEARSYEQEKSCEIAKEERPIFHMSTPIGWMNDPNGLIYFQGRYHGDRRLCHQYRNDAGPPAHDHEDEGQCTHRFYG